MCGIFFAINNESGSQSKISGFLNDAFYASQVRGTDGSGMAVIGGKTDEEKKHPFFFKNQSPATNFLEKEEVQKAIVRAGDARLSLCHVRAATHGEVNAANAHPFKVIREDKSYIIGVHNGTLNNWKNHPEAKDFSVDSHWALHMIAKLGKDAFEYFSGAWAFVWWDSNTPDKVYMCRNESRPLHFIVDVGRKLVLGASEPGMLGWLAERNKVYVAKTNTGGDMNYYLNPGSLFTVDINSPDRWEVAKLPSYNYLKLFPSASSGTYSGNPRYAYRSERHSYDALWASQLGRDWGSGSSAGDYEKRKQDRIIGEFKEALGEARTKRFQLENGVDDTDPVVDSDELSERLVAAINEAMAEEAVTENDDPFGLFVQAATHDKKIIIPSEMVASGKPYYLSDPLSGTATAGEIKLARKKQVFGQVVRFLPVIYDPTDQALIGDIELIIKGTKVRAVGEVRHDITAKKAEALINNEAPILVSIVGSTDYKWPMGYTGINKSDTQDPSDVYVLANLTKAQRESAFRHMYH